MPVPHPDHQRLGEQAAAVEVFQQGGYSLVHRREKCVLEGLEVVAMRVPIAIDDGIDREGWPPARFPAGGIAEADGRRDQQGRPLTLTTGGPMEGLYG